MRKLCFMNKIDLVKNSFWLVLVLIMVFCMSHFTIKAQTDALHQQVLKLSNHADVMRGTLALSVYNVNDNTPVYQFNENKFVKPASILKLITTGVALDQFGALHRIKTVLGYSGSIQNGVLKGNLIIKGNGDPTFGSNRFGEEYTLSYILQQYAMAILNAGITSIDGNILVDASNFDTAVNSPKWLWEDIGNYYGAGAAGFNVQENKYVIEFSSAETGEKTQIINTYPNLKGLELINEVRVGEAGSGDNAYVFGAPFTNQQYVRGTIPPHKKSFKIKAALPNPALFFAQTLKARLQTNGIACKGQAKSHYSIEGCDRMGDQIYTYESPPLKDIVYQTNYKSINLYAECLLKMFAAGCNTAGNANSGVSTLQNFFNTKGFSESDYQLHDGSGLSPINKLTTAFFTQNLIEMYNSANSEVWMNSLSIAGHPNKNGYLGNMLQNTAAANNLQVKSGYMDGVRSYAGFVKDKQNRLLAFTFVVNDYTCTANEMKKLMEPVMRSLAELN